MIAHVFPGQGAQKRGMGQGLFDDVAEFRELEPHIDALLGYSIRQLCLEDPDNRLKETQYTQPALYVVNALHHWKARADGAQPAMLAGHSLGEYNALLAAGSFSFLTGLRLVQKRGELMSQARDGGMAAVLGMGVDKIGGVLMSNQLSAIDIANHNTPQQVVISGKTVDLERARPLLEAAGAQTVVTLPVSAAFHSRYMDKAARAYEDFLWGYSFKAPVTPVIANVTGLPYACEGDATQQIRTMLVKQITHSVHWSSSIQYMRAQGALDFMEMGPGNVLTRMLAHITKT
ncbi:MAG: ACP S-malonyltransferase [Aquabacterium sp.]|uniref:ACP S-malonyltransferase n=1 Tax=Aquabacterium sp. TaxID=1872578 RepID=UPI002716C465|nr:ACP S-malonyltransferase [Aquabacterium sp.]MDO9005935.1 ACP S-malonyltransferase [Aquabacterium sp.]